MLSYAVLRQIFLYGVVGVVNNSLGYGIYLGLTFLGLDPKITISMLYPIGAATAYFGHSRYSFDYTEKGFGAPLRYIVAHAISFNVNLSMLYVFWQLVGWPHQLVQAMAILVCAGVLFLLFKYFVFPGGRRPATTREI
jgi:putative flippase GtrA